ncbi:MAG: hypothetical protein WCI72_00555 [archaeon]
MIDEQKQNVEKLENVQWNAVIEVPSARISLEVQLPYEMQGNFRVYSLSSNPNKKVYIDPTKLERQVDTMRRYNYHDSVVCTNGWVMSTARGSRIS